MKKILFIIPCIFFVSIISKAADSTFTINGKFDKVKSGKIYLTIYGTPQVKDSTEIKNGKFKFTGITKDPATAVITLAAKQNDNYIFFVEPKNLTITGAGDSLKLLKISGSKINADNLALKERLEPISKWESSASKLYGDAMKEKNKGVTDSLEEVFDNILIEKRKVVAGFVKDNPNSMRSALAIMENFAYYAEAEEVEPLYNYLSNDIKKSNKGIDIKKMVDVYKTVSIGNVPPDFTQTTPEGKQISLSSLKGKYVLVDFWASWCGPCRRENPNIVRNFQQYKENGFDVFGVSYDTKKANWEKAIKDDKLDWQQVSDLLGWKNATSALYGIKAIPTNFLLDKEGKIIAKNIFGKKLDAKLAEILQ